MAKTSLWCTTSDLRGSYMSYKTPGHQTPQGSSPTVHWALTDEAEEQVPAAPQPGLCRQHRLFCRQTHLHLSQQLSLYEGCYRDKAQTAGTGLGHMCWPRLQTLFHTNHTRSGAEACHQQQPPVCRERKRMKIITTHVQEQIAKWRAAITMQRAEAVRQMAWS